MKNLQFLIVDDHQIIRESLTQLFRKRYPQCEVSEAADETGAVKQMKSRIFHLVILDVNLPGSDALGLMEYFSTGFPTCPVIVFSMHQERVYEEKFIQAGARGFVSKAAGARELENAVDMVLRGRKYINPEQWLSHVARPKKDQARKPFETLSSREFQIALLLLNGHSVTEISSRLSIHSSTTGTHKAHILKKVGAKSLAEFFRIARLHQVGE